MSSVYTFVLTDIENSTRLWEKFPQAMNGALEQHDGLLRGVIEAENGRLVKSTGDGLLAVFDSTAQAARMAIRAQHELAIATWADTGPLRVRMALHSGEAEQRQGDYFGRALNRTARLMALAHGGQVLLSSTAAGLVQDDLPQGARLLDLGEYRLKDLERPEHVYQLAAQDLQGDFPSLRSLDSFPNNLPVQLTSFVGRKKELTQAHALLEDNRLLTLTGPGGTGKTRLSLQLVADEMDQYPDGAWLIELAPLTDPEMVPQGIASALNIPELPGRTLVEAVADFLRYKTSLMILDNCEHLIDACAVLAEHLLKTCPKLTILASSREPLGIGGEAVMRIPPLSVPKFTTQDATFDADAVYSLQEYDSITLFVERAQAVSSGFNLDSSNARAVSQVCQRLDGIPLAIELAAARVRLLPPSQIAERLDDRFRLLTGGSRTALPRQQTLHALIEWSWDLLDEPEKALLRRLAVFSGGFDLPSVEDVCAVNDDEHWLILDCLDDLVNKSLVVAGEENGIARFTLLETIRQFARDRLRESGEGSQMRERHLEYFARFTQVEGAGIRRREMVRSLENLDREYENIRGALEWGLENRWVGILDMAGSLLDYWEQRALKGDGAFWLKDILELIDQLPLPETSPDKASLIARRQAQHALLQAGYALIMVNQVESRQLADRAESACRLARSSGDQRVLNYALLPLILTSAFAGDFERSAKAGEEAVRIAREFDDPYILGRSLLGMAMVMSEWYDDREKAEAFELEISRLVELTPNPWLVGMLQLAQGMLDIGIGKIDVARQAFEKGIVIFTEIKNIAMETAMRSNLAHLERQSGNICRAAQLYQQTLPRWLEGGQISPVAHQFESLGFLCLVGEDYALSARFLGFAKQLRDQSSDPRRPRENVEYEAAMDRLRMEMGDFEFKKANEQGKAMQMEPAMDLANDMLANLISVACA